MGVTALNFTAKNGIYESDAIQATSTAIGVNIVFPTNKNSRVIIAQSCTGENFSHVEEMRVYSNVFDFNIVGLIAGQYIKIKVFDQPTTANILQNE